MFVEEENAYFYLALLCLAFVSVGSESSGIFFPQRIRGSLRCGIGSSVGALADPPDVVMVLCASGVDAVDPK